MQLLCNIRVYDNSYSKIENNQSKLTVDMLQKLAKVLDVSPMDIMNHQPAIVNFQSNQGTQNAIGYIETFVSSQKELFEKLITSKDMEIDRLSTIVNELLKDKK